MRFIFKHLLTPEQRRNRKYHCDPRNPSTEAAACNTRSCASTWEIGTPRSTSTRMDCPICSIGHWTRLDRCLDQLVQKALLVHHVHVWCTLKMRSETQARHCMRTFSLATPQNISLSSCCTMLASTPRSRHWTLARWPILPSCLMTSL